MAYIPYSKLRKSEFDDIAWEKDKVQDMKINQLKLELHDSYRKDEKIKQILKQLMMKIL